MWEPAVSDAWYVGDRGVDFTTRPPATKRFVSRGEVVGVLDRSQGRRLAMKTLALSSRSCGCGVRVPSLVRVGAAYAGPALPRTPRLCRTPRAIATCASHHALGQGLPKWTATHHSEKAFNQQAGTACAPLLPLDLLYNTCVCMGLSRPHQPAVHAGQACTPPAPYLT